MWHYNFCLSLSLSTKASPCARASPNPVTSRRKVPMKLPRNPAQVSRSGAPSVEHSTRSHAVVVVVCALRWALSLSLSKAPCFHRCLSESPSSFHFARSLTLLLGCSFSTKGCPHQEVNSLRYILHLQAGTAYCCRNIVPVTKTPKCGCTFHSKQAATIPPPYQYHATNRASCSFPPCLSHSAPLPADGRLYRDRTS